LKVLSFKDQTIWIELWGTEKELWGTEKELWVAEIELWGAEIVWCRN
jgi:hypothetical protein